jgi:hypothetical protein
MGCSKAGSAGGSTETGVDETTSETRWLGIVAVVDSVEMVLVRTGEIAGGILTTGACTVGTTAVGNGANCGLSITGTVAGIAKGLETGATRGSTGTATGAPM